MMDADFEVRRSLPILGRFRGMQLTGVAPEEMSIAITPVIRKLTKRQDLSIGDIDLWELHEAYAVTTLYNQAQLQTPWQGVPAGGTKQKLIKIGAFNTMRFTAARQTSQQWL